MQIDKRRHKAYKSGYMTKKALNELWNMLGDIEVRCPSCNHIQKVRTVLTVKCLSCGRSFMVCPKNKPSRIVSCPQGKIWILHQIVSLSTTGKYIASV